MLLTVQNDSALRAWSILVYERNVVTVGKVPIDGVVIAWMNVTSSNMYHYCRLLLIFAYFLLLIHPSSLLHVFDPFTGPYICVLPHEIIVLIEDHCRRIIGGTFVQNQKFFLQSHHFHHLHLRVVVAGIPVWPASTAEVSAEIETEGMRHQVVLDRTACPIISSIAVKVGHMSGKKKFGSIVHGKGYIAE